MMVVCLFFPSALCKVPPPKKRGPHTFSVSVAKSFLYLSAWDQTLFYKKIKILEYLFMPFLKSVFVYLGFVQGRE